MHELWTIMGLPLLACLVLTGMHAYLGFHVIQRQVIFVDLALAQIAALGAGIAMVSGFDIHSTPAYFISLGFTILGAAVLSLTRIRNVKVPHEALIGIVYVCSAALLILVLSSHGEGDEHIRQMLVGNVILVSSHEVMKIFVIYSVIGAIHYFLRRPFLLVSTDPAKAVEQGMNLRFWDFIFYSLFGVVVTCSVNIAGILLVFAYLIVPPVCAILLSSSIKDRLMIGWGIGFLTSIAGLSASYHFDWPTGAAIVCMFGFVLALILLVKAIKFR